MSATILVLALFLFGKTNKAKSIATVTGENNTPAAFNIDTYIEKEKEKLSPQTNIKLTNLEQAVKRGDVLNQSISANEALATFWKDSAKLNDLYIYYKSCAAKLENSEKNLTFAARLYLNSLRTEENEVKLAWKANETIDLFKKAIAINPNDDDLRIGLGSAYIYGKGRSGNAQQTMEGILELLAVVRKDSTNIKAQQMLGVGGILSGQYEKAIDRLIKVVTAQPNNAEAVAYLADAYAGKGNKVEAIKWYNISKRLINDAHYTTEVNERIKNLK